MPPRRIIQQAKSRPIIERIKEEILELKDIYESVKDIPEICEKYSIIDGLRIIFREDKSLSFDPDSHNLDKSLDALRYLKERSIGVYKEITGNEWRREI